MKTVNACIVLLSMSMIMSCNKKSDTDSKDMSNAQNEEKFDSTETKGDAEFVVNAIEGGMLEVKLGELAQSNGTAAVVKNFGKQMVEDHSNAGKELQDLANSKHISFPGTLSDKHLDKYNELAKKAGSDFDKAYAEYMVKDHKEDISEFEKEADKGNDRELQAWAAGKIETLKHHLMMAEEAEKKVNSK